jgi:hypothetical protein
MQVVMDGADYMKRHVVVVPPHDLRVVDPPIRERLGECLPRCAADVVPGRLVDPAGEILGPAPAHGAGRDLLEATRPTVFRDYSEGFRHHSEGRIP